MMKLNTILEGLILEKLIMYNHGADYGQVVWLAGGTASGKGFAIDNFMQPEKFKIIDVDRIKELYLTLRDFKDKFPELRGLDLGNPEHVSKLHKWIKKRGVKDRMIQNILRGSEVGRLPNIMFDVTLDEMSKISRYMPQLKNLGYESDNMHITWVLTNYDIAVERNRDRERVVPDDIVLQTHEGAAETMVDVVKKGTPRGVNGSVRVILNNPEHTITYDKTPDSREYEELEDQPFMTGDDDEESVVIKDFKYLTLKEAGKSFKSDQRIKKEVFKWIKNNVPKTANIWNQMNKD